MNWDVIIPAVLTALCALLGTYFSNRKQTTIFELRLKLLEDTVHSLGDKVDKHNNFDRRLVAIETKLGMGATGGK